MKFNVIYVTAAYIETSLRALIRLLEFCSYYESWFDSFIGKNVNFKENSVLNCCISREQKFPMPISYQLFGAQTTARKSKGWFLASQTLCLSAPKRTLALTHFHQSALFCVCSFSPH